MSQAGSGWRRRSRNSAPASPTAYLPWPSWLSMVHRDIPAVLAAAASRLEMAGSDENQANGPEHSRRTAADLQVTSQI